MSSKELPTECISETYTNGQLISRFRTTNEAYDKLNPYQAEQNDPDQNSTNLLHA